MGRLDGKVALITGAGSGMGREATHAFVRERKKRKKRKEKLIEKEKN